MSDIQWNKLKVKVKRFVEEASLPKKATLGSAGYDLTVVSAEWDRYRGVIKYSFGVGFEIPEGYVGLLFPRSSVYKTDLDLTNCVGVIDSDYRGAVSAVFRVLDPNTDHVYKVGERAAQIIFLKLGDIELYEVQELSSTERGEGGYGHTGL